MLASMAKHTQLAAPGMHVYHVASSTVNPLTFQDLFQHFSGSPVMDAAGQPIRVRTMQFCDNMEQYASDTAETNATMLTRRAKAVVAQVMNLGRLYEPYTFYGGRFDIANTKALLAEMSEEERARFFSDAGSMDWEDYFIHVHVPGVRKHVMRARGSSK